MAVGVRNSLYSRGWLKAHRVDAAVISVGNITTGGTGKTPLVVWLCELIISSFKSQISSLNCAILTRGYKAAKDAVLDAQDYSDEVAIFAESCPGAKVIVDPDRVAGAEEAIVKFGANILVMDDGLQHRRLARDLDIVAVDATEPFGYGKLLPVGLLREPVSSLKRAQAIVITRCDQVPQADVDALEKKLLAANPGLVVARSIHRPVCARSANNQQISVEQLKGRKVFAFCGIGNPDAFLSSIRNLGAKLAGSKVYDDHYHYTDQSLAEVRAEAGASGADIILTTQKDWTKVSGLARPDKSVPLAYLVVEIRFLAGQDRITSLIEKALAGRISRGG
jgi:tetraacyldisaccharide 4'-kinase